MRHLPRAAAVSRVQTRTVFSSASNTNVSLAPVGICSLMVEVMIVNSRPIQAARDSSGAGSSASTGDVAHRVSAAAANEIPILRMNEDEGLPYMSDSSL